MGDGGHRNMAAVGATTVNWDLDWVLDSGAPTTSQATKTCSSMSGRQITTLQLPLPMARSATLRPWAMLSWRQTVWPGLQCMVDCELWVCSRVTRNVGEVHNVLYIPLLILL